MFETVTPIAKAILPHKLTGVQTTLGIFVNVKLNDTFTVVDEPAVAVPQSICLAVNPPTTIPVAFTFPLTSSALDVSGDVNSSNIILQLAFLNNPDSNPYQKQMLNIQLHNT